MIAGVSCIYHDECPDVGMSCVTCEFYDSGDYDAIGYREYLRCLVEAQLEYLEIIKDYSDGNEVID